MQFHISRHHTPENCVVHRSPDGLPHPAVTSWSERCKEIVWNALKGPLTNLSTNIFHLLKQVTWINRGC